DQAHPGGRLPDRVAARRSQLRDHRPGGEAGEGGPAPPRAALRERSRHEVPRADQSPCEPRAAGRGDQRGAGPDAADLPAREGTSIHLTLGKHLWEFHRIAEARGEPLPVAFAIGVHPAIALGALAIGSIDEDERAIMGALLGEPLELVKCETSDVLVPAHAEMILEGEILPTARVAEGPFGEFTGYSLGERQREVVKVKAITHRRDAMFQ